MTALTTLRDLLIDELRNTYDGENQLLKALPGMAHAAANPALKKVLLRHLTATAGHVARLEQAFRLLEAPVGANPSRAMEGLLETAAGAIALEAPAAVRDARLVGTAKCIEHYELAVYGTTRWMAEILGENEVAYLLQDITDEKWEANESLGAIAPLVYDEIHAGAGTLVAAP